MNNAFLDVFEEPLELKFTTQYKPDKVTISGTKAQILRDGAVDRPSRGQKTVSSLGLILAFLKLKDISQVLILDEFMSDVSVMVTPKVVDLLTKIGTQVIWVTHSQVDLSGSSNKLYYVTKRAGVSSVSPA
jgi:ABC-type phosphate transport system ATPase subunit